MIFFDSFRVPLLRLLPFKPVLNSVHYARRLLQGWRYKMKTNIGNYVSDSYKGNTEVDMQKYIHAGVEG